MNIFVLDLDPVKSAVCQCDEHVVKMVLESAQMLCSAFENGDAPYRRTHYNHPCSVWVRQSKDNFNWLVNHGLALADEYSRRFPNKVHKSRAVIEWCQQNVHLITFPTTGLTPFAQAMPDEYKLDNDPVSAYRAYYINEKKFATWKYSSKPDWYTGKKKVIRRRRHEIQK